MTARFTSRVISNTFRTNKNSFFVPLTYFKNFPEDSLYQSNYAKQLCFIFESSKILKTHFKNYINPLIVAFANIADLTENCSEMN